MAWDALTTVLPLSQGVDSAVVQLRPAETAHVQMLRTGVVTDLILIQVFSTLELGGPRDQVPLFAFGLRSNETSISFIMRGIWGFLIQILNGEGVPSGSVTADFRYKKDGVNIG